MSERIAQAGENEKASGEQRVRSRQQVAKDDSGPVRLSASTKRIIIVGGLIASMVLIYAVRGILTPFILALMFAYTLNPVVCLLMRSLHLSRPRAVALLYLVLLLLIIVSLGLLIPLSFRQLRQIHFDFQEISFQVHRLIEEYNQIELFGYRLNLYAVYDQVSGAVQSVATFLAARTGGFLIGVVSGLAYLVLILLVSFYLLKDADRIPNYVRDHLPRPYWEDLMGLWGEINTILSSFLRGQILLCLVIGVVTGITLALLGVRNALILGILAGVLEIIPNAGPVLSAVPAVLIAFFQGSTLWPVSNTVFALIVIGAYVLIQQLENNFLVPKIIGESVNLHPVIVLFGVVAGASLAGVLGVFLAAPVMASGRVLARYLWRKVIQ